MIERYSFAGAFAYPRIHHPEEVLIENKDLVAISIKQDTEGRNPGSSDDRALNMARFMVSLVHGVRQELNPNLIISGPLWAELDSTDELKNSKMEQALSGPYISLHWMGGGKSISSLPKHLNAVAARLSHLSQYYILPEKTVAMSHGDIIRIANRLSSASGKTEILRVPTAREDLDPEALLGITDENENWLNGMETRRKNTMNVRDTARKASGRPPGSDNNLYALIMPTEAFIDYFSQANK